MATRISGIGKHLKANNTRIHEYVWRPQTSPKEVYRISQFTRSFTGGAAWVAGHITSVLRSRPIETASATNEFCDMVPTSFLSHQDREQYERDGYLVVKNLIPQSDLNIYEEEFRRICTREVKVDGITLMRDVAIAKSQLVTSEETITRIQLFQNNDVLFSYCSHPEIIKYISYFLGPNIMALHGMLINKPPDLGMGTSRHPMHQDLHYFAFRPADSIICSWTAMQHINRTNGCLVVIPGSHRDPGRLMEHEYPDWENGVNKMYYGVKDYKPQEGDRVHLVMEPGDTVFFHPLIIHGSGTNRSQGFRKSISCHYCASECEYINVEGTSQQMVQDEIREMIKHKLVGKDAKVDNQTEELIKGVTLAKYWSNQARCVSGKKINI